MQVHIVVDNLDVSNTNSVNLRAAVSAALLLLPSEFTEVYFLTTLFTLRVGITEIIQLYPCRQICMPKYVVSHTRVMYACYLLRIKTRYSLIAK